MLDLRRCAAQTQIHGRIFCITVPTATTVTALVLGMPVVWWLLIGLGLASVNVITVYVLAKLGLTEYGW